MDNNLNKLALVLSASARIGNEFDATELLSLIEKLQNEGDMFSDKRRCLDRLLEQEDDNYYEEEYLC
jgi:hypothetical protein